MAIIIFDALKTIEDENPDAIREIMGGLLPPQMVESSLPPLKSVSLNSGGGFLSGSRTEIVCEDETVFVVSGIISGIKPGSPLTLLSSADGEKQIKVGGKHYLVL